MTIRAKFKCTKLTITEGGSTIELSPVTTGSEENKEFFKYTPFGSINIGSINPQVSKELEVGKEFYVDFTKAN